MSDRSNSLRDWLIGIENAFFVWALSLVVARRGIAFIYWMTNPDEWEAYMKGPAVVSE